MVDMSTLFPAYSLPRKCEYNRKNESRRITLNSDGTFSGVRVAPLKYANKEALPEQDLPGAFQITLCRDTERVCQVAGLIIPTSAIKINDKQGSSRHNNQNVIATLSAITPRAEQFISWLITSRLKGHTLTKAERTRIYILITDCSCKDLTSMTLMKRSLVRELEKENMALGRHFNIVAFRDLTMRGDPQVDGETGMAETLPAALFKRRENDPYSLYPESGQGPEVSETGYELCYDLTS